VTESSKRSSTIGAGGGGPTNRRRKAIGAPAELLASLPPEQLATFLKRTSDRELEAIEHDWGWWGRPNQQAPKGDWRTWLLLAGRVDAIAVSIAPGEFFSLLGPSGSGTTTTLMMVAGFCGHFSHTGSADRSPTARPYRPATAFDFRPRLARGRARRERGEVKATGRKLAKPVFAYSIAWHPGERPTKAEQLEAARSSLEAQGLEEHQAIILCHDDEPQAHVHIIVNRVHPATGKAATLSNSKLKLSQWAEGYERKRGKVFCPQRVSNNARRSHGEFVRHPRTPRPVFEFNRATGCFESACADGGKGQFPFRIRFRDPPAVMRDLQQHILQGAIRRLQLVSAGWCRKILHA
jgi:energy-coupling factor transporter ATP-binding protein EcfA2